MMSGGGEHLCGPLEIGARREGCHSRQFDTVMGVRVGIGLGGKEK